MPVLAGLFVGLFSSLAGFFARMVGVKVAFGLAAVTVFSLLTVAFVAAIGAAITAIAFSGALPDAVILGFAYFMPPNFAAVMGAIFAADIVSALYHWNSRQLDLFMSGS